MILNRRNVLFILVLFLLLILTACSPIQRQQENPDSSVKINNNRLVKIITKEAGFYKVNTQQFDPEYYQNLKINQESFGVVRNGEFQPFWIEENHGQINIFFFAPENLSQYTSQQVTIIGPREDLAYLQSLDGKTVVQQNEISATLKTIGEIPARTINFEENHSYQPQVKNGDHWLWEVIQPSGFFTYQFDLPKIRAGEGKLSVSLWGMTEADVLPDHRVYIQINDWKSEDFSWDGRGYHQLELKIPSGILKEEGNVTWIYSPGDTGAEAEINWLDSLLITYPIKLEPVDEQIVFVQGNESVDLRYFKDDVDIYNFIDFNRISKVSENLSNKSEWSGITGKPYWLISESGYLSPSGITPFTNLPDYRNATNSADYVVIAPGEWEKDVEPLLKLREEQGLQSLFIPIEAIYDQFQWGYPEPESIRQFLRVAQKNWQTPPIYVLLLGDSTYDTRNYLGQDGVNFIPSFFVESQFGGETISDAGFSDLEEAPWSEKSNDGSIHRPGLAVGRIPVQNSDEVKAIVEKIIKYEQAVKTKSIESKVLMVADGQDLGFQQDAKLIGENLSKLPEYFFPGPDSPGLNEELLKLWGNAYDYIFYFGHGSIQQWGKDQIFSSEDVHSLPGQNSPPIVIQFTCLTGFFSHPVRNSLSEDLILKPDGGAIGLLAPTSLTLPQDQNYLGVILAQEIDKGEHNRLGDLFLTTWQQYWEKTNSSIDVYQTFLLIGDPALTLP